MHIGVDLDNTILDATSAHLTYYNQVSGLSLTPDDVNDFYIFRLYGWDKTERDSIYHQYGFDIHWNSVPFPMAAEVLNTLINQHEITFITARPSQFRDVSIEWLKRYKFAYHHIVFTEKKLKICMDLKIDVLIDDGPHYAEEFSQANKPVILYDQPYNQSIHNALVYRALNWMDVKKHIEYIDTNLG